MTKPITKRYKIEFYVDFGSDNTGKKAKKITDDAKEMDYDVWLHFTVKQLRSKHDDQHAFLLIQVNDNLYTNERNNNLKDTSYSDVKAYTGRLGINYATIPIRRLRLATQEMGKFS